MSAKNILLSIFLICFLACEKIKPEKKVLSIDSTRTNIIKVDYVISKLNPKAKELVKHWNEYQKLDEFIQQYQKTSISNALLNAKELSELSKQLKDSIRVEKLKISSVKVRLSVLHNETLRLADMATINHITNAEVIQENKNILEAYSAFNLKINNIISQEKLNNDVNMFIEDIINEDSITSKKKKLNQTQL